MDTDSIKKNEKQESCGLQDSIFKVRKKIYDFSMSKYQQIIWCGTGDPKCEFSCGRSGKSGDCRNQRCRKIHAVENYCWGTAGGWRYGDPGKRKDTGVSGTASGYGRCTDNLWDSTGRKTPAHWYGAENPWTGRRNAICIKRRDGILYGELP